jgi:hypothetical protein
VLDNQIDFWCLVASTFDVQIAVVVCGCLLCIALHARAARKRRNYFGHRPEVPFLEWCEKYYGHVETDKRHYIKIVLDVFGEEIGVAGTCFIPTDRLDVELALPSRFVLDDTLEICQLKINAQIKSPTKCHLDCPHGAQTLDEVIREFLSLAEADQCK